MPTYSRFDYIDAVRELGDRYVELIRRVGDGQDKVLSSDSSLTVVDAIGNMACTPSWFIELTDQMASGSYGPIDLAEHREKCQANLTAHDLPSLTDHLLTNLDDLLDKVSHLGAQVPVTTFPDGLKVRADAALGILVGEFFVNGLDVSRTLRLPWKIDAEMVPLVARGRHQLLPNWINTEHAGGHTATYDVRLRGVDEHYVYEFTDGQLRVNPEDPRPADVHISSEPVSAMLTAYGRMSPWSALMRGRAVAWGSRPWLALRLPRIFSV